MSDNIIEERLSVLDPAYAELVRSDFTTEVANQFGQPLNFTPDQTAVLDNAITLFLLFMLDFESFIAFISTECAISEQDATLIAGAVLNVLPSGFSQLQHTTVQQFTTTSPSSPAVTNNNPTNSETVHTTTQAAILGTE